MELIYLYPCPHCKREVPLISPTRPDRVRCDACGRTFPIVPIHERSNRFVKLMTANGLAAVDPDFM